MTRDELVEKVAEARDGAVIWQYLATNGDAIARVRRPRGDVPYEGYPVHMVGPQMGPVRNFVARGIDAAARTLVLEPALSQPKTGE